MTTKKVHFRSIAVELLWFLRGDSNVGWLQENGVTIWDEWASPEGELGPVYGVQWRSWPTPDGGQIDQIADVLDTLRSDPDSRRMIVSAWNVAAIPDMALAPCHTLFQFYVADGRLSCQLYQRSADMFLGVPVQHRQLRAAHAHGGRPGRPAAGDFVWVGGDCHIYSNHTAQVREQLSREVLPVPDAGAGAGAVAVRLHASSTSRCTTTGTTRRSGQPWRCDRAGVTVHDRADLGAGRASGSSAPTAACPGTCRRTCALFQRADHGRHGRHGPAHLGVAARALPAAAGPDATSS